MICEKCKQQTEDPVCPTCNVETFIEPYINISYSYVDDSIYIDMGTDGRYSKFLIEMLLFYINLNNQDVYESIEDLMEESDMIDALFMLREIMKYQDKSDQRPVVEPINAFKGIVMEGEE